MVIRQPRCYWSSKCYSEFPGIRLSGGSESSSSRILGCGQGNWDGSWGGVAGSGISGRSTWLVAVLGRATTLLSLVVTDEKFFVVCVSGTALRRQVVVACLRLLLLRARLNESRCCYSSRGCRCESLSLRSSRRYRCESLSLGSSLTRRGYRRWRRYRSSRAETWISRWRSLGSVSRGSRFVWRRALAITGVTRGRSLGSVSCRTWFARRWSLSVTRVTRRRSLTVSWWFLFAWRWSLTISRRSRFAWRRSLTVSWWFRFAWRWFLTISRRSRFAGRRSLTITGATRWRSLTVSRRSRFAGRWSLTVTRVSWRGSLRSVSRWRSLGLVDGGILVGVGDSFVGNFSDIATVSFDAVSDHLGATVGHENAVGTGDYLTVTFLLVAVVILGFLIFDGPVEVVRHSSTLQIWLISSEITIVSMNTSRIFNHGKLKVTVSWSSP